MSGSIQYDLKLNDHFSHGISHAKEEVGELGKELRKLALEYAGFEFLKESANSFMELETAADDLRQLIGSNGGLSSDFDELNEQAEQLAKTGIFGVKDTEAGDAIAAGFGLAAEKIKELTPIVEDFAARRHIKPVEAWSEIVKSTTGKIGADLKVMGITVDKNIKDPFDKLGSVIDQLTPKVKGSQEEIAKMTYAGQIANMKVQWEEFTETVGHDLLKAFISLKPYIVGTINFLKDNITTIERLGTIFLVTVSAFKAYGLLMTLYKSRLIEYLFGLTAQITGTEAATAAQIELNAAMDANPIGAVIIALGLLAGALSLVIGNYNTLREHYLSGLKSANKSGAEQGSEELQKQVDLLKEKKHLTDDAALKQSVSELNFKYNEGLSQSLGHVEDVQRRIDNLNDQFNSGDRSKIAPGALKQLHDELDAANIKAEGFKSALKQINGSDPLGLAKSKNTKDGVDGDMGSGITVTGARPQDLTININHMIETFNVNSTNLTESKTQIKEYVSQVLLEVVNDANTMTNQ